MVLVTGLLGVKLRFLVMWPPINGLEKRNTFCTWTTSNYTFRSAPPGWVEWYDNQPQAPTFHQASSRGGSQASRITMGLSCGAKKVCLSFVVPVLPWLLNQREKVLRITQIRWHLLCLPLPSGTPPPSGSIAIFCIFVVFLLFLYSVMCSLSGYHVPSVCLSAGCRSFRHSPEPRSPSLQRSTICDKGS